MRKALVVVVVLACLGGAGGWYYLYGPCGTKPVADAHLRLKAQADHWSDALKIAGATPLIALAGPLGKLQDIKHETTEMRVPQCAEPARELLSKSMNLAIDGFLSWMSMPAEDRQAAQTKAPEWALKASDEMEFFQIEMTRLETCAPTCTSGAIDWTQRREARETARQDKASAEAKAAEELRTQTLARQNEAAAAEASARAAREREATTARAAAETAQRAEKDREDRELVARSLPGLKGPAASTRYQATMALLATKLTADEARAAVPVLIENLSNSSTVVRGPAAQLLGNIGAPMALDALPLLDSLVKNDYSSDVKTQARAAAQKIRRE